MRTIAPERVYFTFPDRALSYECRGCGACCKGLGIGLDASSGELERLVERYPEIAGYARQRGATWTAFNPHGGCWFLNHDGWCRLERDGGRAAKPAACRLFPFNRVFRLGSWWVVDFNSVICPLRAPEPGADEDAVGLSGRVAHQDVLDEICGIQDDAVVGIPLPLGGSDADALIARERRIAEACFEAAEVAKDDPARALALAWDAQSGSAAAREATEAACEALLGRPWRAPEGETLRRALLVTPSLRFNERFGPRAWSQDDALGAMWLAWLCFVADGVVLNGEALSLQQMTALWGGQVSVMAWLARWGQQCVLSAGPVTLNVEGERHARIMRFAQTCAANTRRGPSVGALLRPILAPLAPVERVAMMRHMEPLLARATFRSDRRAGRSRRKRR